MAHAEQAFRIFQHGLKPILQHSATLIKKETQKGLPIGGIGRPDVCMQSTVTAQYPLGVFLLALLVLGHNLGLDIAGHRLVVA